MRVRLVSLLLMLSYGATAQSTALPARNPGSQVVEMDLVKGKIKDDALAPFMVRPLFTAVIPDKVSAPLKAAGIDTIISLSLFYAPVSCPADLRGGVTGTTSAPGGGFLPVTFTFVNTWSQPRITLFGQNKTAQFSWLPSAKTYLQPNQTYCLLVRRFADTATRDPYQQTVALRTAAKFADYVKLDFGVGFAPQPNVNVLFGSIAIHGYAIPINNDTDLAERFGLGRQLLLRTSLFAGIAPVTFSSGLKQEIKPLTGIGNLIVGVGFRGPFYWRRQDKAPDRRIRGKFVLQSMRLNAGWLFYAQSAANPVETGRRTKATPYIGLTYDFTLTSLLGPIAKLFGG